MAKEAWIPNRETAKPLDRELCEFSLPFQEGANCRSLIWSPAISVWYFGIRFFDTAGETQSVYSSEELNFQKRDFSNECERDFV